MTRPLVTGVAPRWETTAAALLAGSTRARLVRRCADVAELVGVARAGLADLVLVSSDLRGLDREVVDTLHDAGVTILALVPPGDEDAARAFRRWGVPEVLPTDAAADVLDEALHRVEDPLAGGGSSVDPDRVEPAGRASEGPAPPPAQEASGDSDSPRAEGRVAVDAAAAAADARGDTGEPDVGERAASPVESAHEEPDPAQVVVVWGPYGSPGRTTVAVNLAAELATALCPVLLIDADTYGASVAQALAVLDEAPGVAAAARMADQGTLDAEALRRLAPEVRPGLRVLTGLPRADRWPELRDAAVADLLDVARQIARWVVVDVAPMIEQDEELSFDTGAPRRNGAALTSLEAADRVLVVGSGDPVGLQRLVRALDQLAERTVARCEVVVSRVRAGPVGPEPERRIREALHRFAGTRVVHLVPEDRESLDAAILHGRVLAEVRPSSSARAALRRLAEELSGRSPQARSRRAAWWRRADAPA